jgi:Exocyst complex component Sec3
MTQPQKCGGIHLKAVAERARGLSSISNTFCSSLAQIIVTVMEQFKTEVVAGSDHGKVSKSDTHSMIAKKVRDTQRKFQSALLSYIKLIEILAALNPDMLPPLRDAYAEMVAEGILMKKRMKGYFQALPGKNAACMNRVGKNIKDYVPAGDNEMRVEDSVNAPDIRAVLSELLPVIAREAYFTSALFGSMNREQDGREKKRNFENAKNAVDKASVHFRYYLHRTCGVVDATTNEGGEALQKGDPLLCLVATLYLNEIMDSYVDREKKGGDHSLSLAYVRATILDLRKKADKQWVSWVESQIEWIKSNDGVPLTGKRAGIFPSFARFPAYLDHVISCCKEGRDADYFPDLPGIKVINYYLQKMAVTLLESLKDCSRRETTDQAYAAHVMQMENTYHFSQAIKDRGEVISKLFAKQVTKANAICKDSTDAYLGWMIKREFTALHELFSRVSKIRKELGDNDVVSHVPKTQFVKILQKEANRDILKEKIGAMYSRMEKHLSEESDLLPVAWKALVKVLYEWFGRWEKLCTTLYKHKLDPSSVDVVRIAKAAGGTVKPKVASQGTEFGFKSILALGNKQNQDT